MHASNPSTSRSDRQASAHAVQVPELVKHASMHRLMASGWVGRPGCERSAASTAAIDDSLKAFF
jgi:hypothetical protein